MKKRPARLGFAAALLALLLSPIVFGAQSALAQGPTESTYYGVGAEAGTVISASIDGADCGSGTVDADGNWLIRIDEGDCGAAEGSTINFAIDGAAANETATWAPADFVELSLTVAAMDDGDGMDGMDGEGDGMDDTGDGMDDTGDGMDDTGDGMDDTGDGMDDTGDGMDDTGDGMDDTGDGMDGMDGDDKDGMDAMPDPSDTGNAGFATESGSASMLLVLALGVLAAAGVAGARTVTGRID